MDCITLYKDFNISEPLILLIQFNSIQLFIIYVLSQQL
jgi:hypothetical protein